MNIELFITVAWVVIVLVSMITTTIVVIGTYQSNKRRKNDPIMLKRNVAKRYVNKYLRNAKVVQDGDKKKIQHIPEFFTDKNFLSFRYFISTFQEMVNGHSFFNPDGNANNDKMDWIIQQIDLGMYDECLVLYHEDYKRGECYTIFNEWRGECYTIFNEWRGECYIIFNEWAKASGNEPQEGK